MKQFMSLREFLVLRDTWDGRRYTEHKTAEEWLAHYEIAKLSYETYGAKGPPFGSEVVTLRAGFGSGGPGAIRILRGTYPGDDRCFLLTAPPCGLRGAGTGGGKYVGTIAHWWKEFCAQEHEKQALALLELRDW